MPALVPRGNRESRPLEVPEESVEVWTERGYVPAESAPKAPAKKAAAKRAAAKK